MIFVSKPQTTAPAACKTPLQALVYKTLAQLDLPFERVDTDEVITMEDCAAINDMLSMRMVKTLFLCNRQQTEFYLFITTGEKPFRSSDFSHALGVSRVSFAPSERMQELLGTKIGAATVLSALLDKENAVRIVFDRDVLADPSYGCSDGTTTGYLKLSTADVLEKFLPFTHHVPDVISL